MSWRELKKNQHQKLKNSIILTSIIAVPEKFLRICKLKDNFNSS